MSGYEKFNREGPHSAPPGVKSHPAYIVNRIADAPKGRVVFQNRVTGQLVAAVPGTVEVAEIKRAPHPQITGAFLWEQVR